MKKKKSQITIDHFVTAKNDEPVCSRHCEVEISCVEKFRRNMPELDALEVVDLLLNSPENATVQVPCLIMVHKKKMKRFDDI